MKRTSVVLLSIAALMCSDLIAWQRQTPKKEELSCNPIVSKKEETTFASSLSSPNRLKFYRFSPEQKSRAIHYAKNNNITANAAVTKIFKE